MTRLNNENIIPHKYKTIYTLLTKKKLIQKVLKNIRNGLSLTVLGVRGSGKTKFLNTLISELEKDSDQFIYIVLDPNDMIQINEVDLFKHFLLLIQERLKVNMAKIEDRSFVSNIDELMGSKDPFILFNKVKYGLKLLTKASSAQIVIILNDLSSLKELNSSFFNCFGTIEQLSPGRISFVFTNDSSFWKTFDRDGIPSNFSFMRNLIYWLPLPTKNELSELLDEFSQQFEYKLSKEEKEFILTETAGHVGLAKYVAQYFSEGNKVPETGEEYLRMLHHNPIKRRLLQIYNELDENELAALKISNDGRGFASIPPHHIEKFKAMHILNEIDGNTPEIRIITKFVKYYSKVDQKYDLLKPQSNTPKSNPIFIEGNGVDISDGNVYVNGRQIEQDLSQRELHILKHFIQNANKVILREEIAQLIWGKMSADRYSDWAIDQSISRLRKKLGDNAYESTFIKTVKGRGFRYEV